MRLKLVGKSGYHKDNDEKQAVHYDVLSYEGTDGSTSVRLMLTSPSEPDKELPDHGDEIEVTLLNASDEDGRSSIDQKLVTSADPPIDDLTEVEDGELTQDDLDAANDQLDEQEDK